MERNALGWVYLMVHPLFPGAVKVGKARCWRKRLATYNTGCPYRRFRFPYTIPVEDYDLAERIAHRTLRGFRIPGTEWFECNPIEAYELVLAALDHGGIRKQAVG